MARRGKAGRPWQASDLDNLCGVFSTINCARCCLGQARIGYQQSKTIFAALTGYLLKAGRLHRIVQGGMTDRDLSLVLAFAASLLARRWGYRVEVRRPFRGAPPKLREFIRALRIFLSEPGRAALISFETFDYAHLTVVRSVTTTAILLYDSSGRSWLPISSCATGAAVPSQRRPYVIAAEATVFVSAIR